MALDREVPMSTNIKTYLGDGVFARFDGYHIWLTTETSVQVTNTIALEPQVLTLLLGMATRVYGEHSGIWLHEDLTHRYRNDMRFQQFVEGLIAEALERSKTHET
jgi:hypothetical protein